MVRKLKTNTHSSSNSQQDLLKKAQEMQKAMLNVQEGLKDKIVETSIAGDAIKIKANGQKKILEIKISNEILQDDDLEDLLVTAVNDVLGKAEALSEKEMESITGGISIPGLF